MRGGVIGNTAGEAAWGCEGAASALRGRVRVSFAMKGGAVVVVAVAMAE